MNDAGTERPEQLRQTITRLMDAQREALDAADRALEAAMTDDDRAERAERLEETLEDIRDILVGASEDVRYILGEDRFPG